MSNSGCNGFYRPMKVSLFLFILIFSSIVCCQSATVPSDIIEGNSPVQPTVSNAPQTQSPPTIKPTDVNANVSKPIDSNIPKTQAPPAPQPVPEANASANKPQEPNAVENEQPRLAENLEIQSIEVKGNIYLSSEKILSATRSRVGQQFITPQAQEDCKRIANLPGVEFAYFSVEPVGGNKLKLIYVVKEKVVLRQLTFKGDPKTNSKKLTEQVGFQRGDYLDKLTASSGAEKLTDYYKKMGFPFAKITHDDSQISKGILQYTIDKGPKVKIKRTDYQGNTAIKKGELNTVIKSKPKNLLVFQNFLKQKDLDDDLVRIQQAYDKRGYLDTKVNAKTNFIKDGKGVDITFVIQQGKQYDVNGIFIKGNEFLSDANLVSKFKLKKNVFYSNQKADDDKEEILKKYRERGFVDAKVESTREFVGTNKVNAKFDVNEGPRCRIDSINISGNQKVQDRVVRRILDEHDFKPGEWYNANIAQGTGEGNLEKELKSDVYAQSAVITPVGDKADRRDAEVRIKEGKTGSIMFGAGISSDDGLIGQVVYEQRNFDIKNWPSSWKKFFSEDAFKGGGQTLRVAFEPGTEVSSYSVSWTEPYLHDRPIALTLAGSNWERERESYNEERTKGYVGFTHRLKEGWYRILSFRFEDVQIKNVDRDAPEEVKEVKGSNLLGGIKTGFGRNTTDNRYAPTKGHSYELTYEQVVGTETFGKVEGVYRRYQTLREDIARRKTVWELKLFAASTVGNAPVFEKYYGGGSSGYGSIRGFAYRGVSPRSGPDHDPIGSKWIATASNEIVVPLYTETLAGLFFVDAGLIETGGVRASGGIGIQIMLPQWFGPVPMRFELAAPFLKNSQDDTQIFSFSAGALF